MFYYTFENATFLRGKIATDTQNLKA